MTTLSPADVNEFYDFCDCGMTVKFTRPPRNLDNLTLQDIFGLGFVMATGRSNIPGVDDV